MISEELIFDDIEDELEVIFESEDDAAAAEEIIEWELPDYAPWNEFSSFAALFISAMMDGFKKLQRIEENQATLRRIKEQYPYLEVDTSAEVIPYTFKVNNEYRSRRMMECVALYPPYTNIDVNHYSDYKDYIEKYNAASAAMAEACRTEIRYRELKIM